MLLPFLADRRQLARLAIASILIAANWLAYIWAVNHGHVIEAALGYYVNPLLTVGLGVVVLGERLRRLPVIALCLGAASVVVLTFAFGRLPWVALTLAVTVAGYGSQKKGVTIGASPSLAVETARAGPAGALHGSGGPQLRRRPIQLRCAGSARLRTVGRHQPRSGGTSRPATRPC